MGSRVSRCAAALATMATLAAAVAPARAQWVTNGNPVCLSPRAQSDVRAVSDGAGGAIVAWADERVGSRDVYAQRVNAAGQPLWATDGLVLCSARGDQDPLDMVSDGAGGAIVLWHDYRCGSSLYAQRVSSSGSVLWNAGGVPVTSSSTCWFDARCVPDGASGVLVAYSVYAPTSYGTSFIQRIDALGAVRWGTAGIQVSLGSQCSIVADGSGGAFVGSSTGGGTLLGQHVDSTGTPLWGTGSVVGPADGGSSVVADGLGGAIYAFFSGSYSYAQRLDPAGTPSWVTSGVVLSLASGGQYNPVAVPDGAHGAIVVWWNGDLWGQRVSPTGSTLWLANGSPVCAATGDQDAPSFAPDGNGGIFAAWQDSRSGGWDIYAQRVSSAGYRLWVPNGLPVCTAANDQTGPALVPDGHGGIIAAWRDGRVSAVSTHVYAERVDSAGVAPGNAGVAPVAAQGFRLLPPAPNPTHAGAVIAFTLSAPAQVSVDLYDIQGRHVRDLLPSRAFSAGRHDLAWDGRDGRGNRVSAGLYFVRVRAAGEEGRCRLIVVH